jgi:3-methyladenine DNA glycosylase Mpg
VTRYLWVLDRKAEGFAIKLVCKIARVSRQAFCDWGKERAAGPTNAEPEQTLARPRAGISKGVDRPWRFRCMFR